MIGGIEDWDVDDPAGQPLEKVREIRDDIDQRVRDLVDARADEIRTDRSGHTRRLAQAPHLQWAQEISAAMQPFTAGGVYVNALGDEPADRLRSAFGSNWPRLSEIKQRFDPENIFCRNANIPPATA